MKAEDDDELLNSGAKKLINNSASSQVHITLASPNIPTIFWFSLVLKERLSSKKTSTAYTDGRTSSKSLIPAGASAKASPKSPTPVVSPACTQHKTAATSSPLGALSPSDQRFPFIGQGFSHSLYRRMVPLVFSYGHAPFMADGAMEKDRRDLLELAVMSANIGNARDKYADIVQKYPQEMQKLYKATKNAFRTSDKVLICFKFDLQYLLYHSLESLTIIVLAGQ